MIVNDIRTNRQNVIAVRIPLQLGVVGLHQFFYPLTFLGYMNGKYGFALEVINIHNAKL